jgi:cell wall-associated NlpC family hydrolase
MSSDLQGTVKSLPWNGRFQATHVVAQQVIEYGRACSRDRDCLGQEVLGRPVQVTTIEDRLAHIVLPTGDKGWTEYFGLSEIFGPKDIGNMMVVGEGRENLSDVIQSTTGAESPVDRLPVGSLVTVVDIWRKYSVIKMAGGRWGCMLSGSLVSYPVPGGEVKNIAQKAATAALKLIGTPFRRGGCTPYGTSDSGLVHFAYRLAGVEVSPDKQLLLEDPRFERVMQDKSLFGVNLEPGDLLIFGGTDDGDTLVGLALGNGEFIFSDGLISTRGVRFGEVRSRGFFSSGAIRRLKSL